MRGSKQESVNKSSSGQGLMKMKNWPPWGPASRSKHPGHFPKLLCLEKSSDNPCTRFALSWTKRQPWKWKTPQSQPRLVSHSPNNRRTPTARCGYGGPWRPENSLQLSHKNIPHELSQAWWSSSVVSATWEADAGIQVWEDPGKVSKACLIIKTEEQGRMVRGGATALWDSTSVVCMRAKVHSSVPHGEK